jgi:MFS family permease
MPHRASLDWLNFLLADVRGGLGPYVQVYLLTRANWDAATIGFVLTLSGLIGIALHAPVGALIDASRAKRALVISGVFALSASALGIAWMPTFAVVLVADIAMAVLGAVFAPTVAAITLGLVGRHALAAHLGRNAAFDRAGNVFITVVAGTVGSAFSQTAVFYLVPFFAVLTTLAVLSIPATAIDHDRARGLDHPGDAEERPASLMVLLSCRPFLVLAAALALFHFANAPMLPLAAQKLALAHPGRESALTAAVIMTAQIVMIPMAMLVARADTVGRKPLLLIAAAALPIRGCLFAISQEPTWLILTQVLDGVAGGLLEPLVALVLADLMRGTGRYNISRGVLGTVQGVGGSLSQVVAGEIVVKLGYGAAFVGLAAVGALAFLLLLWAMPETGRSPMAELRQAARPSTRDEPWGT